MPKLPYLSLNLLTYKMDIIIIVEVYFLWQLTETMNIHYFTFNLAPEGHIIFTMHLIIGMIFSPNVAYFLFTMIILPKIM